MVHIDNSKCVRCGRCADNCPVHALLSDKEGDYRCVRLLCFRCGQCVAICPEGAVTMEDAEPPLPYDPATFSLEPDNLLNAMRFRRSIRRFNREKVSRQEIETLLEAGRVAPSSSNSQSTRFTVLDQDFEALRPKIWKSFGAMAKAGGHKGLLRRYESYLAHPNEADAMFYGANQMIVATAHVPIDGCLSLANMELLAHAMGLGTLYCGFATRAILGSPELRDYFGVTNERQLCGSLVIGRTDIKFYRTAPKNPVQVDWR